MTKIGLVIHPLSYAPGVPFLLRKAVLCMRLDQQTEATWRIDLLGGLCVRYDNRVLLNSLPRKAGLLLARLAIHKDRIYPREVLIEMLWPDEDPDTTRLRFRQVLTTLRRDLNTAGGPADELILSDRSNVHLNPLAATTDAAEFETALRMAARVANRAETAPLLQRAVDRYGGELLPGYYDDWVLQERERLADAYIRSLGRLAEVLKETGDVEAAIGYARKAVAADPLREESYCDLMRLLAEAGRSVDGVRIYDTLKQRLWKDLRVIPSERTREQMEAIRSGVGSPVKINIRTSPLTTPSATTSTAVLLEPEDDAATERQTLPAEPLPSPLTNFFGRETEIAELVRVLDPIASGTTHAPDGDVNSVRFVTLVGLGGCGKTRLALETARRLIEPFCGAVWFVRMAEAEDADQFANTLADVLCPQQTAATRNMLDQIVAAIGRRDALLVLDNLEQAVDAAGRIVRGLLERAPGLRCLATSRRRLNIEGEMEYSVAPLPLPEITDAPDQLAACPSLRLFIDRAKRVRSDFAATPGASATLIELCRRLEGVPLALELAAAWAAVLTPVQMLERLSERFDLLISRRKDLEERHRSLRTTIAWSYDQLHPALQRLFARLSVFQGGWTLKAAEAVCSLEEEETGSEEDLRQAPAPLLDALEQLRERSLVIVEHAEERVRFRMLQTLKEFASAQLSDEEARRLRARHAAYYLALAEQAYPGLVGPDQLEQLNVLEENHDNLRAALEWSLSSEGDVETGLYLFGALWRFWDVRCCLIEAEQWWTRLSAKAAHAAPAAWARGLEGAGCLAVAQDQDEIGRRRLSECLSLYRSLGEKIGASWALCHLALAMRDMGEVAAARPLFEECLATFRAENDLFGIGRSLAGLAGCSQQEGDAASAHVYLDQAAAMYRICGHARGLAWCVHTEGYVARRQNNLAGAVSCFQESLALYRVLDDRLWMLGSVWNLAQLARIGGDPLRARTYGEEALGIARRIGAVMWEAGCLVFLGDLAAERHEEGMARRFYREALRRADDGNLQGSRRFALMGLARLVASGGRLDLASRLLGAASSIDASFASGLPWDPPRDIAAVQTMIGVAEGSGEYDTAFEQGAAMTREQVNRLALAGE